MLIPPVFDNAAILRQVDELLTAQRFVEAETILREALASGSGPIPLWRQLFHALRQQGRIDESRQILEMIVLSLPGDMASRFDLAEVLLSQGEFTRGWREYRFRYKLQHTVMFERHVQTPRWEGQPIKGKTLLIHDEQGFGDTFQFLRMVAWARERSGARVILEVNAESLGLAQRYVGYDELVVRGAIPPAFDVHCELMSLPMAMGLQLSDLPGSVGYLNADPARVEKWRARLADLPRPIVGLVWAGRPTHGNDAQRSMSLSDMAPLAQDGITFVALQKGPAAQQAANPPPGMELVSLSDQIDDFDDTAAILSLLDLLISVDSAPVHLAGALGCPAWVLLPFVPEWRWLIQRDDTPWYPGMRLFRQPARGAWPPMLQSVSTALGQWRDDTMKF
ncbi:tetratricopeptide repeat protein [Erwinia sp. AnSW2-5]|uniref:tetratricopeptide repeat protein n=1 Tax=Erwinia sp. AnSW2-5 TaxID=3367692 RepID=UPI00385BABFD